MVGAIKGIDARATSCYVCSSNIHSSEKMIPKKLQDFCRELQMGFQNVTLLQSQSSFYTTFLKNDGRR